MFGNENWSSSILSFTFLISMKNLNFCCPIKWCFCFSMTKTEIDHGNQRFSATYTFRIMSVCSPICRAYAWGFIEFEQIGFSAPKEKYLDISYKLLIFLLFLRCWEFQNLFYLKISLFCLGFVCICTIFKDKVFVRVHWVLIYQLNCCRSIPCI